MPYVTLEARKRLLNYDSPNDPGELNYVFTRSALCYVKRRGLSYRTINDVVGALECAKQEFYRRVAVPYEQGKIEQNGDVYP